VRESIVPPPSVAVEALREALSEPKMSHYGFQLGYVPFREAAAAYLERRFGVRFDPLGAAPAHRLEGRTGAPGAGGGGPRRRGGGSEPGYGAYIGGAVAAGAEAHRYALTARTDFLVGSRRFRPRP
jgi:aspartate/methionine/tyrosine aminotransferase